MLVSRGATLLKHSSLLKNGVNFTRPTIRNSHGEWYYRGGPPPNKRGILFAEIVGGVAWWWVLWHLWTQFDHITGEFEYPDPKKWSNEELGIPSSQ